MLNQSKKILTVVALLTTATIAIYLVAQKKSTHTPVLIQPALPIKVIEKQGQLAQDEKKETPKSNARPSPPVKAPEPIQVDKTLDDYAESAEFTRYLQGPKFLRPFYKIQQYALKTPAQKKELHQLLSSSQMIFDSLHLLHTVKNQYSDQVEKDRMMAISYLSESLRFKHNPQKEILKDQIYRFLEDPYLAEQTKDRRLRRSLAGDRVELFSLLLKEDPSLAHQLLQDTADAHVGRLYQYVMKQQNKKGRKTL